MTRDEKREILRRTFERMQAHAQWHYDHHRIEVSPFPDAIVPCAGSCGWDDV